jgi:protein-L-isoaspartate(D-aspartate) O-methyltransferase
MWCHNRLMIVEREAAAELDPPEARRRRAGLVERIAEQPPWPAGASWDRRVLRAIGEVPRHLFMPPYASLADAYADEPYPIGHDQTISQPTVVALMTQALQLTGGERVLEIGTGSGYQGAVLSQLAREVFTIERIGWLGEAARARFNELGMRNVAVRMGDGHEGWPEEAPFDRVLVTAAPAGVPPVLVDQLAMGGVLVAPVGSGYHQMLMRWIKRRDGVETEELGPVRFVPMLPGMT